MERSWGIWTEGEPLSPHSAKDELDAIVSKLDAHFSDTADLDSDDEPNQSMRHSANMNGYLRRYIGVKLLGYALADVLEDMSDDDALRADVVRAMYLVEQVGR